jgi:hypothetical protein
MKHEAVRRELPDGVTLAGRHTIVHLSRPVAEQLLASAATPQWRRVRMLVALHGLARRRKRGGRRRNGQARGSMDRRGIRPLRWPREAPTRPQSDERGRGRDPHRGSAAPPRGRRRGMAQSRLSDERDGRGRARGAALGGRGSRRLRRRSFATWLNEAGVAESTIKRLMGHAGSGVTQCCRARYSKRSSPVWMIRKLGVEREQVDGDLASLASARSPRRAASTVLTIRILGVARFSPRSGVACCRERVAEMRPPRRRRPARRRF